ncbi:MAG: AMP-binding protein, partial [Fibrobacter sp.]|nr:AMP-binding protein [Fibrobacter sp.]
MSQTTITPVKRNKTEHPLSWYQERMWLLNQKNPKDLSYNIPIAFLLEGKLNYEALKRSLSEILHRHETLRARFKNNPHGEAVQVISEPESFTLPLLHIQESEIPHYIEENIRHVFDLINKPIINGQLLRIDSLRHLLLLNVHHIAADGWSIESIFFSELQKCYEAFSAGKIPELKPLPVQYIDFAYWHRQSDMSNGLAFWQKHLDGYESSLELPTDFVRTPQSGRTSERFEYSYPADFSEALEKFAQAHGCTMFMCLLAGFALTINRYTGKDDICIGTTTSGRILPEIENLIGFFINILPLRISVDEESTVCDFLNAVRHTALSGFDHQTVPFERIASSLSNLQGNSSNSLVPLVIRHQNFPRTNLDNSLSGGVKFGSYPGYEGYITATGKDAIARCEVELSYTGDRNKLEIEVMYASDLYKPSTIKNLLLHHQQLMREMIADDKKRLCDLTMLTSTDRQRLLVEFNRTKREIKNPDNFVLRWDKQVQKTPDAVACNDSHGKWHYRDIAAAANSFAIELLQKGIKPGDSIGVCMERSASMLASILAIWKTGAAYVPLDPSYPDSYLSLITNDAKPKLIVCTSVQQEKFAFNHNACFIVDEKLPQLPRISSVIPTIAISPDDPAYTMYTSGSTGRPKGVKIPHRQLINWLDNLETNWPFEEG